MRSQKFTTTPKGTTSNAEAHCVQKWSPNSKGGWVMAWTIFVKKKRRRRRRKVKKDLLLQVKALASPFLALDPSSDISTSNAEAHYVQRWSPNSKRGLRYGLTKFYRQKHIFCPKISHAYQKFPPATKSNAEVQCVQRWSPKSDRGLRYGLTKF